MDLESFKNVLRRCDVFDLVQVYRAIVEILNERGIPIEHVDK